MLRNKIGLILIALVLVFSSYVNASAITKLEEENYEEINQETINTEDEDIIDDSEDARYRLYFKDDFSGHNKNWFIALCEDPNEFEKEDYKFCGIDKNLEAYRVTGFADSIEAENLLLFLKYDKQEFGDKLEFDINLLQIEGICNLHFDVSGHIYEFDTPGRYHYETIIDRKYDDTLLKLPNNTTISRKERLAFWRQVSEFAGTSIDNMDYNCDVDFTVDNIKIYKKSNSNWIIFDELVKKVDNLFEKIFG
mgnify:CR=1 FL=1